MPGRGNGAARSFRNHWPFSLPGPAAKIRPERHTAARVVSPYDGRRSAEGTAPEGDDHDTAGTRTRRQPVRSARRARKRAARSGGRSLPFARALAGAARRLWVGPERAGAGRGAQAGRRPHPRAHRRGAGGRSAQGLPRQHARCPVRRARAARLGSAGAAGRDAMGHVAAIPRRCRHDVAKPDAGAARTLSARRLFPRNGSSGRSRHDRRQPPALRHQWAL